jgi:hypothetical protein
MSETILPKLPKKRGRKPKPINLNISEIKPKKRGRKPKNKNIDTIDTEPIVKVYKKRGRRPKNIITKEIINYPNEEPIILHIPIKNNNLKLNIEDEFIKYNPKLKLPKPYDNLVKYNYLNTINLSNINNLDNLDNIDKLDNLGTITYNDNNINNEVNVVNVGTDEVNEDTDEVNEGTEGTDEVNEVNEGTDEVNGINKGKDCNILNKFKKLCNTYKSHIVIERNKIEKIFIEYDMANNNNEWPSSTNIDCLWCCYSFSNFPFGIPIKIKDSNIQMFGNFCSPECASAYIFESIKGIEKWEYYSLLNYLYKDKNDIKLAPPRICLKKFGGKLSINEFRSTNNNYDKNFRVLLPPLISVIPLLEEINLHNDIKMNDYSCKINDIDNLKLKRNKPLPESINTLENCMNLKCV